MVRSIKEEHDIKCRRHKRFKVTTDSDHNKLVYPNVLDQKFEASRPNQSWVSDIIGYIELYYNQTRIQKSLGYKSPRQVWFNYYRQAA